jgi:tetratricopeptide (TPR) repeat protein/transcriptional regulator with XRE-family HTH domain
MLSGTPAGDSVGAALRQARQSAGLTQEELAARTGLSVRAIGDLERGRTARPHSRSVKVLAQALGLAEPAYEQLMDLLRQQLAADAAAPAGSAAPAGEQIAQAQGGAGRPVAGGARPVPAQLPADIADFTGRAEQMARLEQVVAAGVRAGQPGAVTVAVVTGAGGTGKTTLAVHAAHVVASWFPDGQFFAELGGAGVHPAEPAEVLARFLRDLGFPPERIPDSAQERAAQYRSQLTGRRMLIFLDDARDAAQVQPLLPGSASCVVLVTSRRWLSELAGSSMLSLDVFTPSEARQLFAAMVGPGRVAAEQDASEEVLRACAGLPLAIRISGARLAARGSWTVRTMADRLADERRRLDQLTAGSLAVRASFEVGVAALPAPDRPDGVHPAHAFRMLGLWWGSAISLDAAAALLGQAREAVADALEALVDAQLLQSPGPDRYQFHDLLKVYAADQAIAEVDQESREQAIRRLFIWYLHTTEATADLLSPNRYKIPIRPPGPDCSPLTFSTSAEAMNWCETERGNLVAGVREASAHELPELAWQLAAASCIFLNRRRYLADSMESHEVALAATRLLSDKRAEALLLHNMALTRARQAKYPEAISHFEQALAIRRQIGDPVGEVQSLTTMADSYLQLNRPNEAIALLRGVLDMDPGLITRYAQGVVQNNLGEAYNMLGRHGEAVVCLQQAGEIFDEVGDTRGAGFAMHNLGQAYRGLDRGAAAISALERAVKLRHACGDPFDEACSWQALGHAHLALGDHDEARSSLRQAVAWFRVAHEDALVAAIEAQLAGLD